MARDINSVTIIGRLTKDIELNPAGTIGKISVAVNEAQKNQDGTYSDYASYIDVKIFGNTAKNLAQYLTKGQRVGIDGRIHQDRWESKDGQKQSRIVIQADNVELLGGGNSSQSSGPAPVQQPASNDNGFPEDIPF